MTTPILILIIVLIFSLLFILIMQSANKTLFHKIPPMQTINNIPFYTVESDTNALNTFNRYKQYIVNTYSSFKKLYPSRDLYQVIKYHGFGGSSDWDTDPWGYIITKNGLPFMRTKVGYVGDLCISVDNIVEQLNQFPRLHTYRITYYNGEFTIYDCYNSNTISRNFANSFNEELQILEKCLAPYKGDAFGIEIDIDPYIGDNLVFLSLNDFRNYVKHIVA